MILQLIFLPFLTDHVTRRLLSSRTLLTNTWRTNLLPCRSSSIVLLMTLSQPPPYLRTFLQLSAPTRPQTGNLPCWPLTCLHLVRPPIRVLLIPPPLRPSIAPAFTIERSTPFPIDSLRVPYLDTVPYQSRLSDVILRSCSV